MMNKPPIPDLAPRFLQPEGWRWHVFTNTKGKKLRFGAVSPRGRIPDAVIVCLPGLSEFSEKYFEVANDMLDRNLAFWVLDWQGQGKSDRHLANRHKRHASSFDDDIDDLHFFLMEYVKHAAVHPDVGRIPLVMLAHSMGANIGLRYLARHQDIFSCAAFSAPMIGIQAMRALPTSIALDITAVLAEFMNLAYLAGGKDWSPDLRDDPQKNVFSGDLNRAAVHNKWLHADSALQVGNITYGWLHAALKSCYALQQRDTLKNIAIPCLFALAGKDKLVNNAAARKAALRMANATVLEFPDSLHEILMERDDIRNEFLRAFMEMLDHNRIKEKLKTF